ncbi:MAG: iron ABC transporter permease [Alphaproteobacteria bacterium]|nr:MAG: iron ABC transporter permease [Alphaproteobacteria bacterium]
MSPDETKRAYRMDMLLASALVAAGLAVSGVSLMQIAARNPQMAQATPPLQSSPPPADQDKPPAESKPGGERPTTPAPEPARPDAEAQKAGATPALPPAPAEKTAPPIPDKK